MDKIQNLYDSKSVSKLQEMIKEIRVAMLFTKGRGERDEVRPMSVANVDEEGNIWFLSSKGSEKVDSIAFDNNVHLVFAHPGKEMYLDIYGTANVSDDKNLIKKVWSPLAKAWFAGGVDDPDICTIRVRPNNGYYWDTQHGKLVEFIKIISNVVTGKKSGDGVSGQIAVH